MSFFHYQFLLLSVLCYCPKYVKGCKILRHNETVQWLIANCATGDLNGIRLGMEFHTNLENKGSQMQTKTKQPWQELLNNSHGSHTTHQNNSHNVNGRISLPLMMGLQQQISMKWYSAQLLILKLRMATLIWRKTQGIGLIQSGRTSVMVDKLLAWDSPTPRSIILSKFCQGVFKPPTGY